MTSEPEGSTRMAHFIVIFDIPKQSVEVEAPGADVAVLEGITALLSRVDEIIAETTIEVRPDEF